MDINVKLIQVFPVQTITSRDGSKSWQKQEFLTETIDNSQYPRKICFTLFGDNRVGIVDQYQPNTLINVSFDLQSRESNGRWSSHNRRGSYGGTCSSSGYSSATGGSQPSTRCTASSSQHRGKR